MAECPNCVALHTTVEEKEGNYIVDGVQMTLKKTVPTTLNRKKLRLRKVI